MNSLQFDSFIHSFIDGVVVASIAPKPIHPFHTRNRNRMASFDATPTTVGEASVLVASKRVVYVGGLGEDVSQAILRSAMIPFGPIKSLDIPMDYKIGKTRGFAFVEFDDPEDGRLFRLLVGLWIA